MTTLTANIAIKPTWDRHLDEVQEPSSFLNAKHEAGQVQPWLLGRLGSQKDGSWSLERCEEHFHRLSITMQIELVH